MCPHGRAVAECELCTSAETLIRTPSAPGAEAVPDTEPVPGQRIGRFIVIERIGQGGMGLVLSAFDPALDRRVAIKVLRPQRGLDGASGGTTRLVREAQAMAQLSHPNVVPVYDVGRLGESLFVAMEYVVGATLHDWLRAKPRSWKETLEVFVQAGRGLEAAHRAGIVHRDFKPLNVLVGHDGRARVTDFGLARSERSEPEDAEPLRTEGHLTLDTPITIAGAVMGSPGYMAPEQYLGQPTSAQSDQFSFCVALYEALYGVRPFPGNDLATLRALTHAGSIPPPPRTADVPTWVFPLLERGLAVEPAKRHRSMSELLAILGKDPAEARRRWTVVAMAAVLTVSVPIGWWVRPLVHAKRCHLETQGRATVWPHGGRERAEAAFLATKLPFAARAWAAASENLETFSTAWQMERHRACDDTYVRQERSEAQLALRLRCLDRRRVEAETLMTKFLSADAEVVTQAPLAVTRLSAISSCGNVEGLDARAALAPAQLSAIDGIETSLSEARMLAALGRFSDARAVLDRATDSARQSADRQVLAVALLESGLLARAEERYLDARALLEEAQRVALSAGDERTALHATAVMISLVGWRLEQPAGAMTLVPIAGGLVARVADPLLEALLEEGLGDALWEKGDNEESLAAYQRALPLLEAVQGDLGLDVARVSSSVGWLLMERGELGEARKAYERSRATREALLGPDHPEMGPTYNELGHLAYLLDESTPAVHFFTRVLEVAERTPGTGYGVVKAKENLVRAFVQAGRLDEAAAMIDGARAAMKPEFPEASRVLIDEVTALLELARGRPVEAEQAARRAYERNVAKFGDRHRMSPWLGVLVAKSLLAQGKAREAEPLLGPALALAEKPGLGQAEEAIAGLVTMAEVKLALRQPTQALEVAQRAVATARRIEGNTTLKVRTRLVAAEAAWQVKRFDEALELAREALVVARDGDRVDDREAAQVFLNTHQGSPERSPSNPLP